MELKWFIVAVPLFSHQMAVEAYKVSSQNGGKLLGTLDDYTSLSDATFCPGIEMIKTVGIEPFTGGKPIFIPINQFLLLMDAPKSSGIPPELLVCVLTGDILPEQAFMEKCLALKYDGFSIALENLPYSEATDAFYMLADYVVLDVTDKDLKQNILNAYRANKRIRFVITNVSDVRDMQAFKNLTGALFGGRFYSQPITQGAAAISPLKANALQLLRTVGSDEFDFDEVANIIRRDPSISISLLRFINSPGVGLSREIDSIKMAVALLGQNETKKWIMAAISTKLSEDKPSEITKLSLVRAKFAENLATSFELGVHASSLFLAGLFSLLDVILDLPMHEAVKEIAVTPRIQEALVDQKGPFFEVLKLIYAYERADWDGVSLVMIRKSIPVEQINQAFIDALVWYKELLDQI